MFCAQCGNPIGLDQRYCSACGHEVSGAAARGAAARIPGVESAPDAVQSTVAPSTSGKAIASLVFGILLLLVPAAILLPIVLGQNVAG